MKFWTINAAEFEKVTESHSPIIDNFLYKGDTALFKGRSKAGKSTLAQQTAFAVSSGTPFLGCFKTLEKGLVFYLAGEGFIGDWKDRFLNMDKMWAGNRPGIEFAKVNTAPLHTVSAGEKLLEKIKSYNLPFKLFVFDPIMFLTVGGSYNNDTHMNTFFNNIEMIKDEFPGSAAIVVHHDSEKEFTDKKGIRHKVATDDTSMGTSAINAVITHSYTIEKIKKEKTTVHRFKLSNNRSSKMVEDLDTFMIIPEKDSLGRLGFTLDIDDKSASYAIIKAMIQEAGTTIASNIKDNTNISTSTIYHNLNKLIDNCLIVKEDNLYRWVGGK